MTDRFRDQFNPMLIGPSMPWPSLDSTIIRMPLSSECLNNELEFGLRKIKQINERFLEHSSRSLLFLKSVMQVLLVLDISFACSFLLQPFTDNNFTDD